MNDLKSQNALNSRKTYWLKNKALIRNLLVVWAVVSLGLSILLVQPLNTFKLGRVPFGFWMAQQGSIYVFVVLIFVYATQMDKLDRKYGNGSDNSTASQSDASSDDAQKTLTR